MNTYGVTCIPARRSYGEDKCGPYVYLKAASSPPTAPTLWPSGLLGHFCIHKNRTTTPPPPPPPHCHFLLLHALISFFPPLLLFCVVFLSSPNLTFHRDISQLVTDSCSAAAPSPPPVLSPQPPQLVRHSAVPRRERPGAGLTVQEVVEGVTTPCCLLSSCLGWMT